MINNKISEIHMNLIENVVIECPICKLRKSLNIPEQIINKSKQLTTVSIPKGLVCDHTFQIFIDKQFKIRGYQKVDFEFSNIDFYYQLSIVEENEKNDSLENISLLTASCPGCGNKIQFEFTPNKEENIQEIEINKNVENYCGHDFIIYVANNKKILGYSSIRNIDENKDLKDIFSKL